MNEADPTQSQETGTPAPKWLSMQTRITLLVLIAIVSFGLIAGAVWLMWRASDNTSAIDASQQPKVGIVSTGFSPATIQVKRGQSVTWANDDPAAHRVASDNPSNGSVAGFDSEQALNAGDTYTYTFNASGTFNYHDPQNPLSFKGTVIVE
jgi:plastocyanin